MSKARFFVLHGDDNFALQAYLQTLQDKMNDPSGLNIAHLDGKAESVQAVINAVSAMPFLSDKRLIIVTGMLSHLNKVKGGKAQLKLLSEKLVTLPEFARLVFYETQAISDKNAILKLAKSHEFGFEKAFNAPKDLVRWILERADRYYDVDMERNAAIALDSVIPKDKQIADNELAKLVAYVNGERPILEQDVALLTTYVPEANIFEMVDAIGQQHGEKAMILAQDLLNEGSEPLALFGMINRQFRLLLLTREYIDEHGDPRNLAQAIGVHPFVGKKLSQQVARFDLKTLEKIYLALVEFDYKIKTGKLDQTLALQLFIAGVT